MKVLIYSIFALSLSCLYSFIACWTSIKCQISEDTNIYNFSVLYHPCPLYQNKTLRSICNDITNLDKDFIDIPRNIQVLCFKGNTNIINTNAFSEFQQLLALTITLPICTIFPGAFSELDKLEYLYINFKPPYACKNLTFARDMFLPLSSLRNLYLNRFPVPQDKQFIFPKSIELDYFFMKNLLWPNLFDVFNAFQGINFIKVLDLRNNKLHIINDTHFLSYSKGSEPIVRLPNIKELNLLNNSIINVVPGAFQRMNISSLIMGFSNFNLTDLLKSGLKNLSKLTLKRAMMQHQNVSSILSSFCSQFTLKSLSVPQNNIQSVALKECTSLENIDLYNNNLNYIDASLLYQMPQLKQLELSRNGIDLNVCNNAGHSTFDVEILSFNYNKVTYIEKNSLFCIPHLKKLMLRGNNICMIEPSAFLHLQELEWLDLSMNKLRHLGLLNLPNLRFFNLEQNNIEHLESCSFTKLPLLEDLQIAIFNNKIKVWLLPTLRKLSICSDTSITVKLSNISYSLQKLYLTSPFVNFTFDNINSSLPTVKYLHLHSNKELTLPGNIAFSKFFCQLETLIFFSDFPAVNILNMSGLVHLEFLEVHDLIPNLSRFLVNPESLFQNLPRLEVLRLIHSGIQYFTATFFKDMTSLKRLEIKQDYIVTLYSDVQDQLYSLQYLYFFNVTFECDCLSAWLINWAETTKKTFVSGSNCSCLQIQKEHSLISFVEHQCLTDLQFILFVLTLGFLVLFTFVTILYNNNRSLLLHLMYIFWAWMRKTRQKGREHVKYDYDAFVSYSSLDEDWIIQNLIPNLEENGPPFLHLCLHNRDFEIGKDVVDNIMESIYRSRRTICLISRNYLRSNWCTLEMKIATYRLLADQEDVLIVVFLEHISKYQLSSYHRLAKLIKRKTYIDWPEGHDSQIAFWKKLRKAIENARAEDQNIDI